MDSYSDITGSHPERCNGGATLLRATRCAGQAPRRTPRTSRTSSGIDVAPGILVLAYLEKSMSWTELIKRTAREVSKDDAQGLAAQLSYYFFLALFPALLCVIAIASFFPLQNLTDDVVRMLGTFAPSEILDIIKQQMVKIA